MTTVAEVIEHLNGYPKDMHVAVHIWQPEDFKFVAKEEGIKLTKKDIDKIIDDVHNHISSEYGITWLTLENAIQDYKRGE
jgi:hypothetical protein